MLGLSTDNATLTSIQCTLVLTIPDQRVDSGALVFNYFDKDSHAEGLTPTSFALASGSSERGTAAFIENDEQFTLVLPISANTSAYGTFTVQIIPPTGASLTIRRIVPANLSPVMDLN